MAAKRRSSVRITRKIFLSAIWLVFLALAACEEGQTRRFMLPTAPTTVSTPSPAPPPPNPPTGPPPPTASDFTPIDVGQVVDRVIGETPPECLGFAGWPCQYFRVTPPNSGTLVVELTYVPDTQPPGRNGPQGVDVSVISREFEVWAQFGDRTTTRVTLPATGGVEYQIMLWYTFPKLAYELRTSLQPN